MLFIWAVQVCFILKILQLLFILPIILIDFWPTKLLERWIRGQLPPVPLFGDADSWLDLAGASWPPASSPRSGLVTPACAILMGIKHRDQMSSTSPASGLHLYRAPGGSRLVLMVSWWMMLRFDPPSPGVIHPDNIFLAIINNVVVSILIIIELLVQLSRYSQCVCQSLLTGFNGSNCAEQCHQERLNCKDKSTFLVNFHLFMIYCTITRWNSSKIPIKSSTNSPL